LNCCKDELSRQHGLLVRASPPAGRLAGVAYLDPARAVFEAVLAGWER
jgi:hypothetical protein